MKKEAEIQEIKQDYLKEFLKVQEAATSQGTLFNNFFIYYVIILISDYCLILGLHKQNIIQTVEIIDFLPYLSHLRYGLEIWGGAYKGNLDQVLLKQRKSN